MKCPKCGSRMTERNNTITGVSFMGCTRWPYCRKTVDLKPHKDMGAYDNFCNVGLEYENPYNQDSWYDTLREY